MAAAGTGVKVLFIHGGGSKDGIDRHNWPFPKYLKEKFGTAPDSFHMVRCLFMFALSLLLVHHVIGIHVW